MSKLKIKRDITTTNPPGTGQLEVGELAFNAITGKLYTKLQNNIIIEFIGRPICFSRTPIITVPDTTNFCCYGDVLSVTVRDLLPDRYNDYIFSLEDITNVGELASIVQNDNIASDYDLVPDTAVLDPTQTVTVIPMKQAVVPFTVSIRKAYASFIFKVRLDNETIASTQISIICTEF